MNSCAQLTESAADGVGNALQAVDCMANAATAAGFDRLFGINGALAPALTVLLTLYIGFFAISLLTGRSALSVSALTPRAMTLGMVLTFATSWVAYQSVIWNLAVGAPDQVATLLVGGDGSATQVFAGKVDALFGAIAQNVPSAAVPVPGADPTAIAAAQASGSTGTLMWLAGLILLLATVGVLVTARIALAVLLALGPVFVVLALFSNTRGLFAGWLKATVMTAVAPLFVVLCGGFMLELAVPVVSAMNAAQSADGKGAVALFLIASVQAALMFLVLRVTNTIVAGWSVFGSAAADDKAARAAATQQISGAPLAAVAIPGAGVPAGGARRIVIEPPSVGALTATVRAEVPVVRHGGPNVIVLPAGENGPHRPTVRRTTGIGSRYRPTRPRFAEIRR